MLDRTCRLGIGKEVPVLPDQLAVRVDLALLAQVADQVEVQCRAVEAAEVFEAHPEGEMDGAADLLVEEDVAREAVDLVVEAEGDLPRDARALVELEIGRAHV